MTYQSQIDNIGKLLWQKHQSSQDHKKHQSTKVELFDDALSVVESVVICETSTCVEFALEN